MQESLNSSQAVGSKRCKFIKHDYQRRLRLLFGIPCTDEVSQEPLPDMLVVTGYVNLQFSHLLSYLLFPALRLLMLPSQGGADYFSSGETYTCSDGEASPDASPRGGYSSGSGSESEREIFFEFFDEHDTSDAKRIDLVAPLVKSSVLHKRSFPTRCV